MKWLENICVFYINFVIGFWVVTWIFCPKG